MTSKIIAGNWKMHKNFQEGLQFGKEIVDHLKNNYLHNVEVILFPTFIHLQAISKLLSPNIPLKIGAQNCHEQISGPFTGEIAAAMLSSLNVAYVLVGHSERRKLFLESSNLIAAKINTLLSYKIQPFFCCGESISIRECKQQYTFIRKQITESLFHLTPSEMHQIIIAYEPVWSIGTGITPSTVEIKEMQEEIRNILSDQYDSNLADNMIILYGGSCNIKNTSTFINIPGINGVLIGNSSLDIREFLRIIESVQKLCSNI